MSMHIARKWIELNWLRKEYREIPLPELVFSEALESLGCYYAPMHEELLIGQRFYDRNRGIIVVNTSLDDERSISNTLVHEWRHHCQKFYGIEPISLWKETGDYTEDIKNFFLTYSCELDALIYSHKRAPCDESSIWIDTLKIRKFRDLSIIRM